MTKTAWTWIGLVCGLVIAPASYGGNWPIEPRNQTHPIGNSGGEFQQYVQQYGGDTYFHGAIDIVEDAFWPNGHWVVTKDQGTIVAANISMCGQQCEIFLKLADGVTTQHYLHLDVNSIQPEIRTAWASTDPRISLPAGTRVGQVVRWEGCGNNPYRFHHLHFAIVDSSVREPVLSLVPNQDTDNLPLLIENVWFTWNDSLGTPTPAFPPVGSSTTVWDEVDIVAEAFDRQFATPTQNHKTGVLQIQYKVRNASNITVKTGNMIDFSIIPADNAASVLFRDDQVFNSSSDYCSPDEHYYYVVTNVDDNDPTNFSKVFAWDTTQHPNGIYQVEVTIWNNSNSASLVRQVEIANQSTPPAAPTNLQVH